MGTMLEPQESLPPCAKTEVNGIEKASPWKEEVLKPHSKS